MRVARFRPPLRDSFDKVHEIIASLDDDLPSLTHERLQEQVRHRGLVVESTPPQFVFALATGVGKTKLLGALALYLYKAGQTRNVLILASRAAILDKLEREAQPGHAKYLFIDPAMASEAATCFRSGVETFRPKPGGLNVFILSPQSITGKDKRFSRESEFRGFSLSEYLSGLDDLVVFMDEAHHLAGDEAVWTQAVRELNPKMYFGLTATPRSDTNVNILHSYDLATCLREGLYTKAVDLIIEPREEKLSDEDWDRYTLDFALRRLERKKDVLRTRALEDESFPEIEPVVLVCAKDTTHAEEVAQWLREARNVADEEILVTHSEKTDTEDDIRRLVGIDQPGNKVRIVVNVFRLTEGWDVTNVYVVAPLRAMATFQGAVQTMGRGLRLPAGHRVGDPDVDALDVLCCGRESFEEILKQATDHFGDPEGAGLSVGVKTRSDKEDEAPPRTKTITLPTVRQASIEIPQVRRTLAEPQLEFDIQTVGELAQRAATALDLGSLERRGLEEGIAYEFEDFVRLASARVLAELRYLSYPLHGEKVEELVRAFLTALGGDTTKPIATDPVRVALLVADEIDKRYKAQDAKFEVIDSETLAVPDVTWHIPESLDGPLPRCAPKDWTK